MLLLNRESSNGNTGKVENGSLSPKVTIGNSRNKATGFHVRNWRL